MQRSMCTRCRATAHDGPSCADRATAHDGAFAGRALSHRIDVGLYIRGLVVSAAQTRSPGCPAVTTATGQVMLSRYLYVIGRLERVV